MILRREIPYLALATGILAAGIWIASIGLSTLDAMLLRPLPFSDSGRLVTIKEHDPKKPSEYGGQTTAPTFLAWRSGQTSFDQIAASTPATIRGIDKSGNPISLRGLRVTADFFQVLGVHFILGADFAASDEYESGSRKVVLAYAFWKQNFQGDPQVVGRTLQMDGYLYEVTGVLEMGVGYPLLATASTEVYIPASFKPSELERGKVRNLQWTAIARLKTGVSTAQAKQQMDSLSTLLSAQFPNWSNNSGVNIVDLREYLVGTAVEQIPILVFAVSALLLIAAANTACLFSVRYSARSDDISIRAALGATKSQLIGAAITECAIVSMLGTLLGLLLAIVSRNAAVSLVPSSMLRFSDNGYGWRSAAALLPLTLLTVMIVSSGPILCIIRAKTGELLNRSPGSSRNARSITLSSAFVILQVALAVAACAAAILLFLSLTKFASKDTGFQIEDVLSFNVSEISGVEKNEASPFGTQLYYSKLIDSVREIPGTIAVAVVCGGAPFAGPGSRAPVSLPENISSRDKSLLMLRGVTTDYFKLLGIKTIKGRSFDDADRRDTMPVVILSESAVKQFGDTDSIIGRELIVTSTKRMVVGVVSDVLQSGPETKMREIVYLPLGQSSMASGRMLVRQERSMPVFDDVRRAIWKLNPEQQFPRDLPTLAGVYTRLMANRRFAAFSAGFIAITALAISTIGIFAVNSYVVEKRTQEIAVRIAMGASARHVWRTVVSRVLTQTLIGIAIGFALAFTANKLLHGLLFEVDPFDALPYITASTLTFISAAIASFPLAIRATNVDPVRCLKGE